MFHVEHSPLIVMSWLSKTFEKVYDFTSGHDSPLRKVLNFGSDDSWLGFANPITSGLGAPFLVRDLYRKYGKDAVDDILSSAGGNVAAGTGYAMPNSAAGLQRTLIPGTGFHRYT